MAAMGDCAYFSALIDAGKALLRRGSDPDDIDPRLYDLILGDQAPARGTTLFVSSTDLRDPQLHAELRNHLHRELDRHLHPTVTLFDPRSATLVDDFAELDAARRSLGVDINLPLGMDHDSRRRLAPASTIEQRQALRNLMADRSPAGPDKAARYLDQAPPGLTDGEDPKADHSALLGVAQALFGERPGIQLTAIADSPDRVSLADVSRMLGGEPTPLSASQVGNELASGRASAALVHGWPPGSTVPRMRWLYRDDDGTVRWGTEGTPPFNRDGSADPRTRLLEQPQTTALLFGRDGAVVAPGPPSAAAPEPTPSALHLPESSRMSGDSILLGPWDDDFVGPHQRQLRDVTAPLNDPHLTVNVRRGADQDGRSTLEPGIADALHTTLENNRTVRIVLATEPNDQLTWLTTQQHQRSSMYPVNDGWKRRWEVTAPTGRQERFDSAADALRHANSLADPLPDTTMPEVRALLASRTMKDSERFFHDHIDRLRTPEAVDQMARMVQQHAEHGRRHDQLGDGLLGESPFAVPHVAAPAFATLLEVAVNTAADPPARSIAPQSPLLAEAIPQAGQRADADFLFGYLTDRRLEFSTPVGGYMTGLIWLSLVANAMFIPGTGLTPRDGLAVIRAKGELDGERAARTNGQPERHRVHAAIAENIVTLVDPGQVDDADARWQTPLDAIDCLNGEDRVAWYHIIRNVSERFPDAKGDLNQLRDRISACVQ